MKCKRQIMILGILICLAGCASHGLMMQPTANETLPVWPSPPQSPRIQYLKTIAGPADIGVTKSFVQKAIDALMGTEYLEGIMIRPYGIFADADRIYVTDPGIHALHVYDVRRREYFAIKNAQGTDLLSPIGVMVDKENAIFIADSMLRRVMVYDRNGKYLRDIGSPAEFMRPAGIALLKEIIYIVDTHAHQVLAFDSSKGTLLFRFGSNGIAPGEFNFPTNIFVGNDDRLYIMDSLNFRVQIFDENGRWIDSFGKHGNGSGDFSKPRGIAVDLEGHIYVSDAIFDIIQIFDRQGILLLSFGGSGQGKGQMVLPAGLFIDSLNRVYVADSYNQRIQIFQYFAEKKEMK